MVKEKPRRRSVSEVLDWRCLTGCKSVIAGCENGDEEIFFREDPVQPETRRRKRSGTWP